jgi:hypothetical protein
VDWVSYIPNSTSLILQISLYVSDWTENRLGVMVVILFTVSREMHYLWDKYAAFVIVPSQATRAAMIDIVDNDRERAKRVRRNGNTVTPCQLAVSRTWPGDIEYSLCESQYPKPLTYDILFFQPSLFGPPGLLFPHADHRAKITYYIIPSQSSDQEDLEYLERLGDNIQVREFQNIEHVTSRPESLAINPYLMVMNASHKLGYWKDKLSSNKDPVFQAAWQDCRTIMDHFGIKTGVEISMSKGTLSSTDGVRSLIDVIKFTVVTKPKEAKRMKKVTRKMAGKMTKRHHGLQVDP